MTFLLANFSCELKGPRDARGNKVTEKVTLVEKLYLCETLTRRNNGTDLWIVSCEVAAVDLTIETLIKIKGGGNGQKSTNKRKIFLSC